MSQKSPKNAPKNPSKKFPKKYNNWEKFHKKLLILPTMHI